VLRRVGRLASLQLRVERQRRRPCVLDVPERADRRAGVGEEQPRIFLVVGDHRDDAIRPTPMEDGRQPRLECLHRCAPLEPGGISIRERNAPHPRPRPVVGELHRTGRAQVR
jgi:hypothetical protein